MLSTSLCTEPDRVRVIHRQYGTYQAVPQGHYHPESTPVFNQAAPAPAPAPAPTNTPPPPAAVSTSVYDVKDPK
ncbi:hypothetical protein BGW41_003196 [Actinomortierella wolfii]|nr:hypothetical protein BGW41_003196 [Actinomortierella wolfii]